MASQIIFDAIGTKWVIDIFNKITADLEEKLLKLINDRIEEFDKNYSRFRSDSLVTKMSKAPGEYKLPNDAKPLLDLYEKLYKLTGGKVTPLIGNTMEESGYDANYSLKSKALNTPYRWEEAIDYDYPKLNIKKKVMLDFGAAGKGYLVDIIGEILSKNNLSSYCIDAGGDILYRTNTDKTLKVGLENPQDLNQVIGVVELINMSICGSAGNRRSWGKFHHIIDPVRLVSPEEVLATWVVAENALTADGLATALFFEKGEKLTKHFDFEYLILNADYTVEKSNNFPGEVFASK